jgi:hypothetical protein
MYAQMYYGFVIPKNKCVKKKGAEKYSKEKYFGNGSKLLTS